MFQTLTFQLNLNKSVVRSISVLLESLLLVLEQGGLEWTAVPPEDKTNSF